MGRMVTTRSGRFDFAFEPLFVEYFEREHYGLLKEVSTEAGSRQAGATLLSLLCMVMPPFMLLVVA